MERMKEYFMRPWNTIAMLSDATTPRFVWEHLQRVHCTLCYSFVFALIGSYSHVYFETGGWVTSLGLIGSLWQISRIKPWNEGRRVIFFMTAAYFLGATIGPLIQLVIDMDQRNVSKTIMVGIVFFTCHLGAALYSLNREALYETAEFSSPILVTAWMVFSRSHDDIFKLGGYLLLIPFPWYLVVFVLEFIKARLPMWFNFPFHLLWISLLSYSFNYPFLHLLYMYVIVLWLMAHMKMHTQEAIFRAAHRPEENLCVTTAIAFFTHLPAHTISLYTHTVGMMMRRINGIRRLLHLR